MEEESVAYLKKKTNVFPRAMRAELAQLLPLTKPFPVFKVHVFLSLAHWAKSQKSQVRIPDLPLPQS